MNTINSTARTYYDIIIIGAGPAGLRFALSLAETKLKILLVEKQSINELESPLADGRDIALTHLSIKLLKQFGARMPVRQKRLLNRFQYCQRIQFS